MSHKKIKRSNSSKLKKEENGKNGHQFKSGGGGSSCGYCGKFVWGKKGTKCGVCNLMVHQKCMKDADKTTSCNSRITNTKILSKFKKKNPKEKLRSLKALSEGFIESGVASAANINTFIVMLTSDYARLIDQIDFACFEQCQVTDESAEHLAVNGVSGALELLRNYVTYNSTDDNDAIIASISSVILQRLLKREETRDQLLNSNFLSDIARALELDLEKRTFRYYRDLLDIIYGTLAESVDHMDYFFQRGSVDTVVNFCLSLQKIKVRDVAKELRDDFEDAKLSGAKLVSLYYQVGNRKFQRYIEQKNALPVFLEFIMNAKIYIHHEIDPNEPMREDKVYDSPLCQVYKGVYRGQPCAIKQFDIEKYFFEEEFYKEIGLLTILQAPCVVKFYGAHTKSTKPFILLDYFENGSLEDITNTERRKDLGINLEITTTLVANFALNAALGIQHLHSKNIVHRDIKAANFLVDTYYNVKIIDFGVSRVKAEDGLKMTCVGTPVWMAPEVIKGELYTQQADVYSFSLLVWSMLTGKNPYGHIDPLSLVMEVAVEGYREPIPDGTDSVLREIIELAWVNEAGERPSMGDLIEKLYGMKNVLGVYRTHAHDNVPDKQLQPIIDRLSLGDLASLSEVSTRFAKLICPRLKEFKPEDLESDSSEVEKEARFGTVSGRHANIKKSKKKK